MCINSKTSLKVGSIVLYCHFLKVVVLALITKHLFGKSLTTPLLYNSDYYYVCLQLNKFNTFVEFLFYSFKRGAQCSSMCFTMGESLLDFATFYHPYSLPLRMWNHSSRDGQHPEKFSRSNYSFLFD